MISARGRTVCLFFLYDARQSKLAFMIYVVWILCRQRGDVSMRNGPEGSTLPQ